MMVFDEGISRGERVYQHLLQKLRARELKAGQRIREENLAAEMDVSRTPVREAIARLQARGLLELRPGGMVVATLSRQQVVELYALRAVLEGSAARFAAQYASRSDVALMRHLCDAFAAEEKPAKLATINYEFHLQIMRAAQNQYLMRALNELHDTLSLLSGTTFNEPSRHHTAIEEHQAIVDAIEAGDADRSELTARRHIDNSLGVRLKMLVSEVIY